MDMEFEQKINISEKELLTPLQLYMELHQLKWEVKRLISNADSERGNDGTFQRGLKRLKEDIDKLEAEYRESLFNPQEGIMFKLDRLMRESENRKSIKNQIWAIWLIVIGLALKVLYGAFFNK